jgi:hypothetical protein
MKISEQKLGLIIREEILKQEILKESTRKLSPKERYKLNNEFEDLRTIGDLKKFIEKINSLLKAGVGKEALKSAAASALADVIPFGSTALTLGTSLRKMYSLPDDKKTSSILDILNVDDEVSKIVDDTIEDNFLNDLIDLIDDPSRVSDPIPDMTDSLQGYIKKKYSNRTVTGF